MFPHTQNRQVWSDILSATPLLCIGNCAPSLVISQSQVPNVCSFYSGVSFATVVNDMLHIKNMFILKVLITFTKKAFYPNIVKFKYSEFSKYFISNKTLLYKDFTSYTMFNTFRKKKYFHRN